MGTTLKEIIFASRVVPYGNGKTLFPHYFHYICACCVCLCTVNLEIFERILFSGKALKDIFVTLKIRD